MNRWVLVTGGAQRLGREICLTFAKAGWGVVCHFHRSEEAASLLGQEIEAIGVGFLTVCAELNNAQDAQAMLMQALDQLPSGELQCIINNASLFQPDSIKLDGGISLLAQMQTNFVVPVILARLLHERCLRHNCTANVVNILDQKVMNLNPDYADYTLSKLALERAVVQQAQALAPSLRINAVAPGLIYPSGPQTQENFDKASKVNALKKKIDPRQVALTVLFLAENCCITGQTIAVDNGQHLVPLARDVMFEVDSQTGKSAL